MSEQTVHIVDDDEAMRDSLSFLLGAEGVATQAYESAAALLDGGDLASGCILTDIRMPGMSGLELVGELKRRGVTHPVIVLTGHADVSLAVEAMKAGVHDFLEKPFQDDALLRAVRAALRRGADASARHRERAEIDTHIAELTPRERDVFEAIVSGDSNKAAALRLGISPRTVEIYRANVMAKMRAQTLSDLVRMALLRDQV
ncbi:MAG: response regulator FixJ [Terricaulis sp.]|nr:response regulator FixJ [Terricaulis sp.]